MSILPVNKPQTPVDTPRNFFIWGATMSGKSYLAERFPNPLFLNTDGNALANQAPSIQIRNIKSKQGLRQSAIKQVDEIILELENNNPGYETLVLDVIDDMIVMIEQAICVDNGVQTLGDIPYGKGYALFNQVLQELVMDLKSLSMNIVYISRIADLVDDDGKSYEAPSLKTKYYNVINGNSDLVIQTKRVGARYIRRVTDRRKKYYRSQIDDPKILRILENVVGALEQDANNTVASKTVSNKTKEI